MKLWLKISLWLFGLTVAFFAVAPFFVQKKTVKDTGFKKGLIDSVWMELPMHDVKLLSPGVWGEAWLDTMYFMRVQNVNTKECRTVEIYKPMYYKFLHSKGEFIQLESDSAQVVENQAQWDADSIKYKESVQRMLDQRNK